MKEKDNTTIAAAKMDFMGTAKYTWMNYKRNEEI
jgi:hypothetical protein